MAKLTKAQENWADELGHKLASYRYRAQNGHDEQTEKMLSVIFAIRDSAHAMLSAPAAQVFNMRADVKAAELGVQWGIRPWEEWECNVTEGS